MSGGWDNVELGSVLTRSGRPIQIDPSAEYRQVTVRLHHKGVVLREVRRGAAIQSANQYEVRAGQLILSRIDARNGALGIVPDELDGAIVTSDFWLFDIDQKLVDPVFLDYYIGTPTFVDQCRLASEGTTNRVRLQPERFLRIKVPLPELPEQQRVAALLEVLEQLKSEAEQMSGAAISAGRALLVSAITTAMSEMGMEGQLQDVLLDRPRNGWSARCDNAESGTPVLSLSAVTGFVYRELEFKRTSEATDPSAHYWLRPGDLLITRSNTPDLVGHAAIYNGSPAPCIYPDLMMRLPVDPAKAETRFVHYWLRSTPVRDHIKATGRGTSPTMKKIAQGDVMAIPFPARLSLADQRKIVAWLDELSSKVQSLTSLQESRHTTLRATWAASLSHAFRGN